MSKKPSLTDEEVLKRVSGLSREKRKLFELMVEKRGKQQPHPMSKKGDGEDKNPSFAPTGSPLVEIQPNGSKQPLFFVHPISGAVSCYVSLSRRLGKDQPFYAIQMPDIDGQPLSRIEDMADQYISSIQTVQKKGPYVLGGWSMGGMVAFEMAQKLKSRAEKVSLLSLIDIQDIALDNPEPEGVGHFFTSLVYDLGLPLNNNETLTLNYILKLESDKKSKNFMDLLKDDSADNGVKELLMKFAGHFGLTIDQVMFLLNRYYQLGPAKLLDNIGEYVEFVSKESIKAESSQFQGRLQVFFNNYLASRGYKPKVYRNPAVLFTPSEPIGSNYREPISAWKKFFAGGMEIHKVPGNHYTLMVEPNVRILGEKLRECLEQANSK